MKDLLSKKRTAILSRWRDLILGSYSAQAARFLKKEKDRFANPVGSTISAEIGALFDALVSAQIGSASASLDKILQIRAVQDFTPSQAVSFVFLLKKVIREELKKELRSGLLLSDLLAFEASIDQMALLAFDSYMKWREKVFEIAVREVKNKAFMTEKARSRNGVLMVADEAPTSAATPRDQKD